MPTKICLYCETPISCIKEINEHSCFNNNCEMYCVIVDDLEISHWVINGN